MKKKFNESLAFSIQENTIDEAKRTVRVCALTACLSHNNRLYTPAIVESVVGTLKGKKSFADHDERDTKNLIGKIVNESFKDGKVYADIKISKAKGIASQTWEKIQDGTIDSVSIAATGNAKPVEIDGEVAAEVTELNINSVDFVTEGGVADAKVQRVFESVDDIPKTKEVKEDMVIENIEQLKEKYPDLCEQIEKPLKEQNDALVKEKEEAQAKLVMKEVEAHKSKVIAELKIDDKVKAILIEKVIGKTTDEIDESLKSEKAYLDKIGEALGKEAKIEGMTDAEKLKAKEGKKEETDTWTSKKIQEDKRISEEFKGEAIKLLWDKGVKEMKAYLKTMEIEV